MKKVIRSNNIVIKILPLFFILLMPAGFIPITLAQQISGMVVDKSNKNPLFGTVVINELNGKNTITNDKGQFTLDITGPQCTFLVRHLGYKPARYTIADTSVKMTIELEASNILLGEVIVSAYESKPEDPSNSGKCYDDQQRRSANRTGSIHCACTEPYPGNLYAQWHIQYESVNHPGYRFEIIVCNPENPCLF